MPIIYETANIDRKAYLKILRRYINLQFSYQMWLKIYTEWEVHIVPVEQSEKYREMYGLTKWSTNPRIPWGFAQPPTTHSPGRIWWFINDTANPFIIRQNAEKGLHEAAHACLYELLGSERRVRRFDDPQARAGIEGPAYVTLVHDVAYGYKTMITFWIRWKFMWIPIKGLNVTDHI